MKIANKHILKKIHHLLFFEGHPYILKQNFPSQTCREWFIKLCACGPDFAARNEWPAMMYNKQK